MTHRTYVARQLVLPFETTGPLIPAEPRSFQSPNLADITLRQLEVLHWVQEGKSAPDIGAILGISGRTVEDHLMRVCKHLRVRTRFQAVLKAQSLGLLPPAAP